MKKFAYTLVTGPRNEQADPLDSRGRTLTLRETLIIDEGPQYYREYVVATDGAGIPVGAGELPAS